MLSSIRDAYDAVAPRYDRLADGSALARAEDIWLAADLTPHVERSHGLVLDWGCGTGHLLDYVPVPPANYLGFDLSEGMLAQARIKHPEHRFWQADIARVQMIQPAAIVFLGFDVFALSPTPVDLIANIRRALLPGGLAYVLLTLPDHARAICECHGYTPIGVRSWYTPEAAANLFESLLWEVMVRPIPVAGAHTGSYAVLTARR